MGSRYPRDRLDYQARTVMFLVGARPRPRARCGGEVVVAVIAVVVIVVAACYACKRTDK